LVVVVAAVSTGREVLASFTSARYFRVLPSWRGSARLVPVLSLVDGQGLA
jgi:hypothetical protein